MKIEYMSVEELESWPRNPKRHNIKEISYSLQNFGYVDPIIIDEATQRVVAGHGRIDALKVLRGQSKEPPERVKVVNGQWLVPVLRGVSFKSERDAERFLIADNKIQELGGWDEKLLAEVLSSFVEESEDLLSGIGFDVPEYDKLIRSLEEETQPIDLEGGSAKGKERKLFIQHTCPKCGFKFQEES